MWADFNFSLIFLFLHDFGRKYVIKSKKLPQKNMKILSNYMKLNKFACGDSWEK